MSEHPAYRFDDKGGGIDILRHDLPAPWINYLSNGTLHAFVSQAGGGFCWWKNPVTYRLTRYRMQNLPIDSPGFYIYLRRADGSTWSPAFRPCETPLDNWHARHEPGVTYFQASKDGLHARLALFIAPDTDALVWDLQLHTDDGEPLAVDVFAYAELSQMMWQREQFHGYYWRHMLAVRWDEEAQALLYLDHNQFHSKLDEVPLVYFASCAAVDSYCGNRDAFVGNYRFERDPQAVERGACGNEPLSNGEPCAALHRKVTLERGRQTRLRFFLGTQSGALTGFDAARERVAAVLADLRAPGRVDAQFAKLKDWWAEYFSHYSCELPDADAQRQINLWGPLNCVQTARYSRAVNANAPGIRGIGFRDSCQDMLAMVGRKPEWARAMLLRLLSKQYADGHTVHMIPLDERALPGINTHSDNHLWLPFLAYALLAETGDAALLDEQIPYLAEDHLSAEGCASVWQHLLAAIRFTEAHLGAHNLPLTLAGDWNDIIGKFSRRGLGESVFAGQQYVVALNYMIELANFIGQGQSAEWLRDCRSRQQAALAEYGWDGQWWLRGYDDDGAAIGSESAQFGKLFLNPQSWSALSDTGSSVQRRAAMQSVADHLDSPMGIKKLMPGFPTWPEVNDPFTGYGPGCGENAAIFCHAHSWAVIAEALLGNGERAWHYYRALVPHLALQRAGLQRYQGEPYAWASNIVGPENPRSGWANVTHITGTAAWMDVAATQYLLGVRSELHGLRIAPCIPADWQRYTVRRTVRGCHVEVIVLNPRGVQSGVSSIRIDGTTLPVEHGNLIPYEKFVQRTSSVVEVVI